MLLKKILVSRYFRSFVFLLRELVGCLSQIQQLSVGHNQVIQRDMFLHVQDWIYLKVQLHQFRKSLSDLTLPDQTIVFFIIEMVFVARPGVFNYVIFFLGTQF
jgi:hypothetical protein